MSNISTYETANQICTLVATITSATEGVICQPIYECHSYEKFDEFVAWYAQNLTEGRSALIEGFALGNVPVRRVRVNKNLEGLVDIY